LNNAVLSFAAFKAVTFFLDPLLVKKTKKREKSRDSKWKGI